MAFSPSGLYLASRAAVVEVSAVELTCTEGGAALTGNGKTRDSLLVVKLKAESLGVVA
jgi:hypothetical protein